MALVEGGDTRRSKACRERDQGGVCEAYVLMLPRCRYHVYATTHHPSKPEEPAGIKKRLPTSGSLLFAGLFYRCVTGACFSKVSPSSARSTTTVSPGSKSPPIIRLESGFST